MSDPVARLNAALEGRYAIERELGEGGMATVYLADDLKHERKVALKVLKPELAAVVGAERFLAEIKTTANLTREAVPRPRCARSPPYPEVKRAVKVPSLEVNAENTPNPPRTLLGGSLRSRESCTRPS